MMKPKLKNALAFLSFVSLLASSMCIETHYILACLFMAGFGALSYLGGLWWKSEENNK